MKNREHIEYTYKHRKVVMLLAKKYFSNNQELLKKIKYHDLDKVFMYMFYDKKVASKMHRQLATHHDNDLDKEYLDYVEMVLDWESARYTKTDKPLNAYDTLYQYYPNLIDNILPILKEIGIDKSNLPMDEDISKSLSDLNNITFEKIQEDLQQILKEI